MEQVAREGENVEMCETQWFVSGCKGSQLCSRFMCSFSSVFEIYLVFVLDVVGLSLFIFDTYSFYMLWICDHIHLTWNSYCEL